MAYFLPHVRNVAVVGIVWLGIRPSLQNVADFGQRRTYMFYRNSVK